MRFFRVVRVFRGSLQIAELRSNSLEYKKHKLKVHDELPSLEKQYGDFGEMPSVWGGLRCQR